MAFLEVNISLFTIHCAVSDLQRFGRRLYIKNAFPYDSKAVVAIFTALNTNWKQIFTFAICSGTYNWEKPVVEVFLKDIAFRKIIPLVNACVCSHIWVL